MTRVAGGVTALLLTALLAIASQLPSGGERDSAPTLRLAWRVKGVRVEHCRRRTPEELAALPVHMRQAEVCEGRVLSYRLVVKVDDRVEIDTDIHPAGALGDRPLFVNEAVRLTPGRHRVAVTFRREAVRDTSARIAADAAPERLVWSGALGLAPRQIALLSYDADARRLVAAGYGSPDRVQTTRSP